MKEKDKIKKITRVKIIENISESTGLNIETVRTVYNALDDFIFENLGSANKEQNVEIRLFEGMSFTCNYVPSKEKMNNLTKKKITTKEMIKPKCNITGSYVNKLNGSY